FLLLLPNIGCKRSNDRSITILERSLARVQPNDHQRLPTPDDLSERTVPITEDRELSIHS
ncbi:MAG: hypothetical protein AAGD07_21275, partial [Planctomycetota bacterium]